MGDVRIFVERNSTDLFCVFYAPQHVSTRADTLLHGTYIQRSGYHRLRVALISLFPSLHDAHYVWKLHWKASVLPFHPWKACPRGSPGRSLALKKGSFNVSGKAEPLAFLHESHWLHIREDESIVWWWMSLKLASCL
jgi:hypothetical protein